MKRRKNMNYDLNVLREWAEGLRLMYRELNFYQLKFVGIDKDGNSSPVSSSHIVLRNAQYGVLFANYRYLRITQDDYSFFTLFINGNIYNEYLEENGWRLYLNEPIVKEYITHNRSCIITNLNSKIKLELSFKGLSIQNNMGLCFKYFKIAQLCTTQQELDFLYKMFEQNIEIENLNKQLIKEKVDEYYMNKEIEGYKGILEKINALINENK